MLNQTSVYGYIAFDVQLKSTANGREYVSNALNVRKNYKGQDGKYGYDSIPFTVFGPSAKTFANFCQKGSTVILYGSLQSNLESLQVSQNGKLVNRNFNKITLNVQGFDLVNKPQSNGSRFDTASQIYRDPDEDLPY